MHDITHDVVRECRSTSTVNQWAPPCRAQLLLHEIDTSLPHGLVQYCVKLFVIFEVSRMRGVNKDSFHRLKSTLGLRGCQNGISAQSWSSRKSTFLKPFFFFLNESPFLVLCRRSNRDDQISKILRSNENLKALNFDLMRRIERSSLVANHSLTTSMAPGKAGQIDKRSLS